MLGIRLKEQFFAGDVRPELGRLEIRPDVGKVIGE
jgi:hypothetical protein